VNQTAVNLMDDKPEKPRKDACKLKEEYTSHWDLDALPRDELEALMAKPAGTTSPEAAEKRKSDADAQKSAEVVQDHQQEEEQEENPVKIGLMLLAGAVLLLVAGVFFLRL